ncbi:MAG: TIGR04211 family SH3 domain-containing protein, partial [Candidatus Methylumidiphilus sp.]
TSQFRRASTAHCVTSVNNNSPLRTMAVAHSLSGGTLKQSLLFALLLSCLDAGAETPARIGENPQTLAKLQAENQRLTTELAALKIAKESAEKNIVVLNTENSRLNSEIIAIRQASAGVLQIQNERDTLTEDKRTLVSELDMLKREKNAQDTSSKQNWFMIGSGVLFGGIFLGVFLPRLSWRKKGSWESF